MPSHKNSTKLRVLTHPLPAQSLFKDYLAPEMLDDLVRRLDVPNTDLLITEVNGDSAQWGKSQGSVLCRTSSSTFLYFTNVQKVTNHFLWERKWLI